MRAAAAAVLMLVLALPAGAAQPKRATLQLAGLAPLVVKGRGFGKQERVVLTATAPSLQQMLGVVARRNGSFRTLRRSPQALHPAHGPCSRRARQQSDPAARARL